jgi:chemotaxis protein methyltransferase CheR
MIEKQQPVSDEDLDIYLFIETLKVSAGYDFSQYSEKSLRRRVAKVLNDSCVDLPTLVSTIQHDRNFAEIVVKGITVNTTELFRDPHIWRELKSKLIPRIQNLEEITVWHAGCSTGQEVYSFLILLNECGLLQKAKIIGSDINTDVLEKARLGVYKYRFNRGYIDNFNQVFNFKLDENSADYIPFSKYFDINESKDEIAVKPFLREIPSFYKHDLVLGDKSFFATDFNIIFCRNVVIYFNSNLQDKVFSMFANSLYSNGILILGLHESILGSPTSFYEKKDVVYIKR